MHSCNLSITIRERCKKNLKKASMMDFALHIHTYIYKKPSFFIFFPSDGGKLSRKTTVEKTKKSHHLTFFGYTYIHTLMIFCFFCIFRLLLLVFSLLSSREALESHGKRGRTGQLGFSLLFSFSSWSLNSLK